LSIEGRKAGVVSASFGGRGAAHRWTCRFRLKVTKRTTLVIRFWRH